MPVDGNDQEDIPLQERAGHCWKLGCEAGEEAVADKFTMKKLKMCVMITNDQLDSKVILKQNKLGIHNSPSRASTMHRF